MSDHGIETSELIAIREQEAAKIDPETAVVTWWWADELDPYGDFLTCEEHYVNRVTFCRRAESDIWICMWDLPAETKKRLRERLARSPTPEHELAVNDLLLLIFDALDKVPSEVAKLLLDQQDRLLTLYEAADNTRKAAVVRACKRGILVALNDAGAARAS